MKVLVAGGFDGNNVGQKERIHAFSAALGSAVMKHGHVLLNGCRTDFDKCVAEAAYATLEEMGEPDPDKRIISYVLSGLAPVHNVGTILRSQLADWELNKATVYFPEQIQQADAVILVGGFEGTLRAASWAKFAAKPLLPFTAFGGAAAQLYAEELTKFDEKYSGFVDRLEYEQLNSVKGDWDEHATDLIALAEKVAESRTVLVLMSYADRYPLQAVYETYKHVTEDVFHYKCQKITEENAGIRIVPDILEGIQRAGLTIVDLTDLRPNVLYELGYAEGLGKKVIATATKGTELPFDIKDIPTIFYEGPNQLEQDLEKRIRALVKAAVPDAGPPIGPG